MSILNRAKALSDFRPRPVGETLPGRQGVVVAVAAVAAGGTGLTGALVVLPSALAGPALAFGLLLAAAALALTAWISPGRVGWSRVVIWDTAGALTVIGLAAALLGEPEQAIVLLERDR